MSAGDSAREEAQRSAQRATALARKAEHAQTRAANFEKGADGEQRVARALAPLTADGFHVLHDRRCPGAGGNIDHIVIGPPGIFVIDAKFWTSAHIREGILVAAGSARTAALARAHTMTAEVAGALAGTNSGVPVVGALVFVEAPDLAPAALAGVELLPLEALADALRARPAVLSSAKVEAALRVLSSALPPFDAPATFPSHQDLIGPAGKPSADIMADAYWCFYATEWRGGGIERTYLRGETGLLFGWRDTKTGEVHVEPEHDKRQRRLAEALLSRLSRKGPAAASVTKIPDWWYGKNPIASPLVTFVVGTRWRSGGRDRLYGFAINAKMARVDLGYVDLKTGRIVPDGAEALPGRVATKSVILGHLARQSEAALL